MPLANAVGAKLAKLKAAAAVAAQRLGMMCGMGRTMSFEKEGRRFLK